MKRVASLKLRIVAALTAIFSALSFQPASAAQFATTMSSACNSTQGSSTWILTIPFTIPEPAVVNRIDWKMSNTTVPSAATIKILQDSGGVPTTTVIGSESYTSFLNQVGTFSGTNITLGSAGKYWLAFYYPSTFYACWANPPTTTGTASGWTIAATNSYQSNDGGSTFSSVGSRFSFHVTIFGTGGGAVPTASTISVSTNSPAVYRETVTITASLSVAGTDGKVTYYANGKKIAGCINKPSSGLASTCLWKPSARGSIVLTAKLVPNDDSFGTSVSSFKNILVTNRVAKR